MLEEARWPVGLEYLIVVQDEVSDKESRWP